MPSSAARKHATAPAGAVRVGIGGWNYADWRDNFYPAGWPHDRELEYASRQLTAIEVNATYYRTQSPATFARSPQARAGAARLLERSTRARSADDGPTFSIRRTKAGDCLPSTVRLSSESRLLGDRHRARD